MRRDYDDQRFLRAYAHMLGFLKHAAEFEDQDLPQDSCVADCNVGLGSQFTYLEARIAIKTLNVLWQFYQQHCSYETVYESDIPSLIRSKIEEPEKALWPTRDVLFNLLPEGTCRQCVFPDEKGVHTCTQKGL